jgi:thioredoxin reductase
MHGFLSRDGINPREFLSIGRKELDAYPSVECRNIEARDASGSDGRFEVVLDDGSRESARKILIATGVRDHVPEIDGIDSLYGTSVFHCPYCDGWEWRDKRIEALGNGKGGTGLALELTAWSGDLVLCTDGAPGPDGVERALLEANGIRLRTQKVVRLEGTDGILGRMLFESGPALECDVLFFSAGQCQRSGLPGRLGCEFNPKGTVQTGKFETTNVPGVFVAGDASREAQLAIRAAAEGAEAGMAINRELTRENLERPGRRAS